MTGQERCEAILQSALGQAGVKEADAYLSIQEMGLTRFASNTIHQNVSHSNAQLHVRAVVGRRQGRATTNDLSGGGIQRAAEQARQNALLMPEDPDFNGLPSPSAPPTVSAYDQATGACSPEARARVVAMVCRKTEARRLDASGFYRTGAQETAVLSTKGARAYHDATFAGLLVTAMSDTSAGWSKGGSWRTSDIDAEALADEAVDKALRGRDPQPIEPGEYTVVLDPYAVDDLLGSLSLYGMGAQVVQEGRSWMNGIMGKQAMSPLVSIWDDGADPEGWPAPFDAEGVPRQRVDIVREGVVAGPVHNTYTAGKEGLLSTGHQASFTGGPAATNLFMAPGGSSPEEMIASTRRGLYVTRFHYTRLVHNRGCVMTGMTRDGTFVIEDGRLSYPVKDLRFTQSYVEALAGVEAVGNRRKLVLNEAGFATVVPALKIRSFNFTGVTV
jgi:predicted Zn-dependent protease